ncbi:hypothetical protein [Brevibacterium salitolerans]|uniref:Uncharacterized protein n=1 Tax=Brevibacterium salitolerans TaxID=1403566 RepID=A0ABN2WSB2_9MICO
MQSADARSRSPGPRPGARLRTAGRLLFFIGGGFVLVVVTVGVIVAIMNFRSVASIRDQAVPIEGPTEVQLEAGEQRLYYAAATDRDARDPGSASSSGPGGSSGPGSSGDTGSSGAGSNGASGSAGSSTPPPNSPTPVSPDLGRACEVDGPDPQQLSSHLSSSFTFEGRSYRSHGGFSAGEAGTYTVTCSAEVNRSDTSDTVDAVLAPPVSAQGIVFGVFGVLGGVFGGLLFGSMCMVGLVLWIVGRSMLRKAPLV